MTFVTLLLALLAERFLLDQQGWRQADWFPRYFDILKRNDFGAWTTSRYWGSLVVLAPPLLLVGFIQANIEGYLGGLLSLLFALVVVVYCLGPDDLDNQAADFIDAQDRNDDDNAKIFAGQLCECEAAESKTGRIEQASDAVLFQANQRIFAVVLWFLILGPLGAVFYRLSRHLVKCKLDDNDNEGGNVFMQGVQRLIFILDRLPARATAASYALAGDFEQTIASWRQWRQDRTEAYSEEARGLLVQTGNGALLLNGNDDDDEQSTNRVEAALSLVWRSLVVWLAILALVSLSL